MAKQKPNSEEIKIEATRDVADVIAREKEYLDLGARNGSGIAFSGGGIRSASFGLGVMQAMVKYNHLEKMDYMSTVSGGGYLGAALTWALHNGKEKAGTKPENFPLGKKGKFARHTTVDDNTDDNNLLDFMRQHSSYLMPTRELGLLSFVGVVLRSMLLSLFVYFGVLFIAITFFKVSRSFNMHVLPGWVYCAYPAIPYGVLLPASILLLTTFFVMSFRYSFLSYSREEAGKGSKYLKFITGQRRIGWVLTGSLLCLMIGLLPHFEKLFPTIEHAIETAGASSVFGAIVGLWQYKKAQKNDQSSGPMSDTVIYLGAFALIYGLMLLAYCAATLLFVHGFVINCMVLFVITALTFAVGFFVNINLVGPHRIWRNRLMEAFMPDKIAVQENQWKPAKDADGALMENMCAWHRKPYHLVNTNIILSHSRQVKFSGRGGDNFIISPKYCGSYATGWKATKHFNRAGAGITLATAMATSAAALNPNAAVSGEGVTRNTIVSILLSMLNLRLGCWTSNPGAEPKELPPNFFVPGLSSEIFRQGFKETDSRILLSDGGHFENLGIYELIRRKLELIVLSDGGADPAFNFDDLANAVEKVRVDFSAKIVFREKQGLDNILPGTKLASEFDKKYAIGERGFAIADIYYNNGTQGVLVYIKLAMIEGLPTDVYSYKGLNPSFPHQPTSDQFFDEKQFEAYRELGYQITTGMVKSDDGKKLFA